MHGHFGRLLAGMSLILPLTLAAQHAPAASLLPVAGGGRAQLTPGKWLYSVQMRSGGTANQLGHRTLEVVSSAYDGAPAWLVVDSRETRTFSLAESLYVAKSDLAPQHRIAHSAEDDVVAHYTRDSIVTTFAGQSGVKRVALPNEPSLVASLAFLEPLMQIEPLAEGWHATAPIVFVGPVEHGRTLLDLSVVGSDATLIPDGQFDAWVVSVKVGDSEEKLWVRKSDRVVIKQSVPVHGMPDASLELVLTLHGVRS
ncbi:MAG TPA: hypothetical protein VEI06_13495 [Gemmatimonadaceae bacterium]|nr:hypothetical protein [Gemmatimonadaceae bacterium]